VTSSYQQIQEQGLSAADLIDINLSALAILIIEVGPVSPEVFTRLNYNFVPQFHQQRQHQHPAERQQDKQDTEVQSYNNYLLLYHLMMFHLKAPSDYH